jgi:hypothetical protein
MPAFSVSKRPKNISNRFSRAEILKEKVTGGYFRKIGIK